MSQRTLSSFACHILEAEGVAPQCELSICLCDEKQISRLNCRFLARQGPTDVLAFPQDEPPSAQPTEHQWTVLGDVVICTDVASQQAEDRGVTFEEETLDLLAHGILHLLGYRDDAASARRKMLGRQQRLLEEFQERKDN